MFDKIKKGIAPSYLLEKIIETSSIITQLYAKFFPLRQIYWDRLDESVKMQKAYLGSKVHS